MSLSIRAAAVACAFLAALPARAEPAEFEIDPNHSVVAFLVEHVGFAKVLGMFREIEGSFTFDEDAQTVSDVRVVIQADSLYSNHRARDEHLTGPDFLNAGEFPEIVFTADGGESTGENSGTLTGQLEMLGRSHPVTLDVTLNKSGEHPLAEGGLFGGDPYAVGISARGSFLRSPYGMTYGVDNGWVGDEVELIIEFEALRQ